MKLKKVFRRYLSGLTIKKNRIINGYSIVPRNDKKYDWVSNHNIGNEKYTGQFYNNQRNGYGRMEYADLSTYEGLW